jgi:hypothetical protein
MMAEEVRWSEDGGECVFGIDDPWILLGIFLLFGSTLACVIYGVVYYNKDVDDDEE